MQLSERIPLSTEQPNEDPFYRKELEAHFFDDLERYSKGPAFYFRRFPKRTEPTELGFKYLDATPAYLYTLGTAGRIKQLYGSGGSDGHKFDRAGPDRPVEQLVLPPGHDAVNVSRQSARAPPHVHPRPALPVHQGSRQQSWV